ncbi:MAG: Tat (twin-arginine translocation) pathway signal sequence containing protein [Mongoliibacter sp.]|uniref:metallophosphoesterase family protein n=1 Tax=Mongoliibacter sp. TaxID=2022438 RepID=UPI0012F02D8B|nr:metallophosphoesterase [Mongoliibacter sp.]TVP43828.1 MAG: Tat (twin-arginine translocation) pathway signal sequence containing protein [Mongoliibacter sp.]
MQRRLFLKNISVLSAITPLMPFMTYGKMHFPENPKLKFIIASDGHYGQPDTDFEGSHRTLIQAINREKDVDFVIFNGDLIHDDPKWMPEVKEVYDQLEVPYFPVRGNHDRVTKNVWEDIWGIPTDYAFSKKNHFGFVLADSSNEKGDYLCVNQQFLKRSLDDFSDYEHVFICIHISQNDWTRHGVACQELLDLVTIYPNVKAIIHGHDHDVNGVMLHQKKHYLWTGHFGGSWGSPVPGYRVIEVGDDGKITTYLKSMEDDKILSGYNL